MKGTLLKGVLRGVSDGPIIILEVRGEEVVYPLDCDLKLEWIDTHMGKAVTCLVDGGRVKQAI